MGLCSFSVSFQPCCSVIHLSTLLNFPLLRIVHSRLALTGQDKIICPLFT